MAEHAMVDQHTLRDLPQHGGPLRLWFATASRDSSTWRWYIASSMREANQPRSECPINAAIEAFGDRWSLIVLRDIVFGDRRYFRELQAGSIEGIASNILADRLKRLAKSGLLTRQDTRPAQPPSRPLAGWQRRSQACNVPGRPPIQHGCGPLAD